MNMWNAASLLFLFSAVVLLAALAANINTYFLEVIDVYETQTLAQYCADWGMGYRYEQCYQIEHDRYMIVAGILMALGLAAACSSASRTIALDEKVEPRTEDDLSRSS